MLEELDSQPEDAVVPLGGGFQVTVAQQRSALVNLFTLTMDFIEGFMNHTQGELRSHQAVLKEILEAAQNSAWVVRERWRGKCVLGGAGTGKTGKAGSASQVELLLAACRLQLSASSSLQNPHNHTHTCARTTESANALEETIKRLRPNFREDFLTFLRGEYERVTAPPMTEEAVVLANLLQAVQARVLAEVEQMMGADVSQVSRLLAFADEAQVQTALRGSFLAGTVKPEPFLEMVEMVLSDLDERMPGPLETGGQAAELRDMHTKLSAIRAFTREYLQSLQ
jgi:hypothetical protein